MSVLVLGIGNVLLSDEAIGVRVIEALQQRYHIPDSIEVMDGGTAGMELMDAMAKRQHLIIVDAVLASQPPGSIIELHDDEVPALFGRKISPHQLGLADVLSALHLTDEFPQHLTLIGIVPSSLEPKIALTPVATNALEQALLLLVKQLQLLGVTLVRKTETGNVG